MHVTTSMFLKLLKYDVGYVKRYWVYAVPFYVTYVLLVVFQLLLNYLLMVLIDTTLAADFHAAVFYTAAFLSTLGAAMH